MKFIPGTYLFEVHDTNDIAKQKTIYRYGQYCESQEAIDATVTDLLTPGRDIKGVGQWSWCKVYLEVETQNRWPK